MKTRNIVMIAVLVALFVAAGILLVVGITTHTEPGLVAPDNRWNHSPLSVSCRNHDGSMDGCSSADDTVEAINDRLGFEALQYHGNNPAAEIAVTIGVPSEPGWQEPGGHTTLTGSGTTYEHCEVVTSNTGTSELLFLTLYHEVGCHCFGLQHDDFDSSICRPEQSATPDGASPPRLTDYDRGLLRDYYAH